MANTLPFQLMGTAVILLCVGAAELHAQEGSRPAPKTSGKPSAVSEPRPWTDEEIENLFAVDQKCKEIRQQGNAANPSAHPAEPPHPSHRPNIKKGAPNQYPPPPPDYGPIPKDPLTYWQWFCGLFWR